MRGKDLIAATLFGGGTGSSGGGSGIPQADIDAAFAALAEKGVTVPDGATSADLDDLIASIVTGGGGSVSLLTGTITPASTGAADRFRLPIPVILKESNVYPTSGVLIVYAERADKQTNTSYFEASIMRFYEADGVAMYDQFMYGYHKNMSKMYIPYAIMNRTLWGPSMFFEDHINFNPNDVGMQVYAGDVYRWIVIGEAFAA